MNNQTDIYAMEYNWDNIITTIIMVTFTINYK